LIGDFLFDAPDRAEVILEFRALLHDAAGACGITPEIGIFGLPIQLRQSDLRLVEVKDASSAARLTA
jgi:hypothetical protein